MGPRRRGRLEKSRDFWGSGKNRRRSRRESRDFAALRCVPGFGAGFEIALEASQLMSRKSWKRTLLFSAPNPGMHQTLVQRGSDCHGVAQEKTCSWTIFLPAPNATPPPPRGKSANLIFIVVSPSLKNANFLSPSLWLTFLILISYHNHQHFFTPPSGPEEASWCLETKIAATGGETFLSCNCPHHRGKISERH